MTNNLLQIDIVNPGTTALPGSLRRSAPATGANKFVAMLEKKLRMIAASGDVVSRIAAMLQNGTPINAIVDRIAKQLAGALLRASGTNGSANARSTLQRALASALAPPGGTGPPQTAAALEQRLKDLLTSLSGTTENAGQKNEIPGNILDASPAKEPPAPQKKPAPAQADGVAAFARELLAGALQNAPPPQQQQPQQDLPVVRQPSAGPAVPLQSTVPTPAATDVLTRIIARAINADAQRTASAPAAQSASLPVRSTATPSTLSSPGAVFDRLVAAIAEHTASNTDTGTRGDTQSQSQSQPQPTIQTTVPAAGPVVQTAVTTIHASPPVAPVQPYTALDPNAVLEQIVRGIVIQNAGQSSQIRLRLQPEHLGDVTLKLNVSGSTVSASVVAQSGAVRDILLAGQAQLTRSLANSGLTLGNFSVNVSGGNAGFTGQQQAQQQHSAFKLGGWQAVLSNEDQPANDLRFGPPLQSGARSLVLNHLV